MNHKWISGVDLGPIPMMWHVYENMSKSEKVQIQNTSDPKRFDQGCSLLALWVVVSSSPALFFLRFRNLSWQRNDETRIWNLRVVMFWFWPNVFENSFQYIYISLASHEARKIIWRKRSFKDYRKVSKQARGKGQIFLFWKKSTSRLHLFLWKFCGRISRHLLIWNSHTPVNWGFGWPTAAGHSWALQGHFCSHFQALGLLLMSPKPALSGI
jgi:hypothetical protein